VDVAGASQGQPPEVSGWRRPIKLRVALHRIAEIVDTWLAALPEKAKVYSVLCTLRRHRAYLGSKVVYVYLTLSAASLYSSMSPKISSLS
jgi:hypothetical protein